MLIHSHQDHVLQLSLVWIQQQLLFNLRFHLLHRHTPRQVWGSRQYPRWMRLSEHNS